MRKNNKSKELEEKRLQEEMMQISWDAAWNAQPLFSQNDYEKTIETLKNDLGARESDLDILRQELEQTRAFLRNAHKEIEALNAAHAFDRKIIEQSKIRAEKSYQEGLKIFLDELSKRTGLPLIDIKIEGEYV